MDSLKQEKQENKDPENISLPEWIQILKKAIEEKIKDGTTKLN